MQKWVRATRVEWINKKVSIKEWEEMRQIYLQCTRVYRVYCGYTVGMLKDSRDKRWRWWWKWFWCEGAFMLVLFRVSSWGLYRGLLILHVYICLPLQWYYHIYTYIEIFSIHIYIDKAHSKGVSSTLDNSLVIPWLDVHWKNENEKRPTR